MPRIFARIFLLLSIGSGIYLLASQQPSPAPSKLAAANASQTFMPEKSAAEASLPLARSVHFRSAGNQRGHSSAWRHLPEPLLGMLFGLACMLASLLLRTAAPLSPSPPVQSAK